MIADEVLLERWRAGDADAGSQLFKRHYDAIFRFFQGKAPGNPKDLIQRTFLKCTEARDDVRQTSSFRAYLFAIARNELKMEYRRRRPEVDMGTTSLEALQPSPSHRVAADARRQLLVRALRAGPINDQILLELHYWEGMTTRELAEVFAIPEGTAKSRLHHARMRLRLRLNQLEQAQGLVASTLDALDKWAADVAQRAQRPVSGEPSDPGLDP